MVLKNLISKKQLIGLMPVFLIGVLGGLMAFYLLSLTSLEQGAKVIEKITEKQVYLESSQSISAAESVKQNLVTILTQEDLNKIATRSGDFEKSCFNQEIVCSKLAVILTSDGLVLSGADLSGRDLGQWTAVDWQKNLYQLLKVGQLRGANLYQLVKKGELLLPPAQRAKFFNLKAVLLADLNLLKVGQKVFGVKSIYADLFKMTEGVVVSMFSDKGLVQNIDADYSPIALKFSQSLDGQLLFDLAGDLISVRLASGAEVLADQITAFLKRYSVNSAAFSMVDFGVKCLEVEKKLAVNVGVKVDYGCFVAEGLSVDGKVVSGGIRKNSLAEKIGLKSGDVILEVDNKSLLNASLGQFMMNKVTGESLSLAVLRAGKVMQLGGKL
jgi:hypothetical protein